MMWRTRRSRRNSTFRERFTRRARRCLPLGVPRNTSSVGIAPKRIRFPTPRSRCASAERSTFACARRRATSIGCVARSSSCPRTTGSRSKRVSSTPAASNYSVRYRRPLRRRARRNAHGRRADLYVPRSGYCAAVRVGSFGRMAHDARQAGTRSRCACRRRQQAAAFLRARDLSTRANVRCPRCARLDGADGRVRKAEMV